MRSIAWCSAGVVGSPWRAGRHGERHLDHGAVIRIGRSDDRRDGGAPVAALRDIAVVPESGHQSGKCGADALDAPTSGRRTTGEAEAGQRRRDDMERVGRVAAERGRVGQRLEHLVELDDRSRPPVRQDQRQRVVVGRTHMHEVDVEPVDLGHVLVEAVQLRFARPPVVAVGPVRRDLADVPERDALRPVVDDLGVSPSSVAKTGAEVLEVAVGDVDRERSD